MCLKTASLVSDEDHIVDIMEAVQNIASKWMSLGAVLRIRHADLTIIKTKHQNDPIECLRDMLYAWLQQTYDTMTYGQPSWRMLCQAVHKPVGGNNPALARKIAEEHS